MLDELTKKNPNWDTDVSEHLKSNKDSKNESFNQLTEILLQIVNQIRGQKINKAELVQIFSDYQQFKCFDYIIQFIWNRRTDLSDHGCQKKSGI